RRVEGFDELRGVVGDFGLDPLDLLVDRRIDVLETAEVGCGPGFLDLRLDSGGLETARVRYDEGGGLEYQRIRVRRGTRLRASRQGRLGDHPVRLVRLHPGFTLR